jgi:hypothetical protein
MSISRRDAHILKAHHFDRTEIQAIRYAVTPDGKQAQPPIDIHGDAWQFALKSRTDWYNRMVKRGLDRKQIAKEIRKYYDLNKKHTPFDFLEGYKQGRSKSRITVRR